jgi:hypothetical protein
MRRMYNLIVNDYKNYKQQYYLNKIIFIVPLEIVIKFGNINIYVV